jgi:hypothetical protein
VGTRYPLFGRGQRLATVRAARGGVPAVVLVVALTAALTACSGSGDASNASGTPSTGAGGGTSGAVRGVDGRDGRGLDPVQSQRIRECLSAAGLSMPTPSGGFRTFNPTDRTPGTPGARPSGSPTDGRFRGPGGGPFADSRVRAALGACGIAVPTGRPPGPASASPTGPTASG